MRRRGMAMILTFIMMLVLSGLALAMGVYGHNSTRGARALIQDRQAFYVAEAGWQRARQAVSAGTWTAAAAPGNSYTESFGPGEYVVTVVDNGDDTDTITSSGYVPSQASMAAQRQIVESGADVIVNAANLSLAATAAASSSDGSHPASDANDDDTGTHWQADTKGAGQWLRMDFGSSTTMDQVVIEENSNITGITAVEWSDDASSWTGVSSLSVVESPSKTWTCNFTSTSHRYIRATFNASSSKKVSVEEMETYNTAASSVTLDSGEVTTIW